MTESQGDFCQRMLRGSAAKTAYALRKNADRMVSEAGVQCVGFLTLTVGNRRQRQTLFGPEAFFEGVREAREASRRINNLNRRLLKDLFERAIVVTERHASGAIHFHVLGVLRGRPDIRTGFDFEAFYELQKAIRTGRRRAWRADEVGAGEELRRRWALLRKQLPDYGFGRAELTPIRKTGEQVASYVSKYIEKHVCNRLPEDKHKKLVRYIGDWKTVEPLPRPTNFNARFLITREANKREEEVIIFGDMPGLACKLRPNDFAWSGKKAVAWWAKAKTLAGWCGMADTREAHAALGARWAWHLTETWRRTLGDDVFPGLVATFSERQVLRDAVATRAGRSWLRFAQATETPTPEIDADDIPDWQCTPFNPVAIFGNFEPFEKRLEQILASG